MCSYHSVRRLAHLGLAFAGIVATLPAQSDPVLAEFLASNQGGVLDEDGEDSDWIEIWNPGAAPVDLDGWHLTDSVVDPDRWTFPQTILLPDERILVFASDKDRAVAGQELHTNFKLSAQGEYLALVRPDHSAATAYAPSFPAQSSNRSYGQSEPASGLPALGYFDPPTPLKPNGDFAPLDRPTASVPSGWQTGPLQLSLEPGAPGAQLIYTLDGTVPTLAGGIPYSQPIAVAQQTVVRARSFLLGHNPSEVLTLHYLFPAEIPQQDLASALARGFPAEWVDRNGNNWKDFGSGHPGAWYGMFPAPLAGLTATQQASALQAIPSLCLTMDPDDWFGPGGLQGIYVNSNAEGEAWVRTADLDWIDPQGLTRSSSCGVAIQGGGSTAPFSRGQLSISMRFQQEYGPTKLDIPVFGEDGPDEFDYLILDGYLQYAINQRHGQGSHTPRSQSQELRDLYASDLHSAMGRPDARGRQVHLFLNGHYWGVYGLHERPDHRFAARAFGGDSDDYDYLKHGDVDSGNGNPVDHPSDPGAWAIAQDIAAKGLAPGNTYGGQDSWELFQDYVDLDDYVDYLVLNFYLGNADWPNHNWIAVGRGRAADGLPESRPQFRFFSWDAESILHGEGNELLVGDGAWDRTDQMPTNPKNVLFFHTACLAHPDYALRFADRVWKHVSPGGALYVDPAFSAPGTPFDPAQPQRNRPAALYHQMSQSMAQVVPFELARWVEYFPANPSLVLADWHAERARLLTEYMPVRTAVLIEQLRSGVVLYPNVEAPLATPRGGEVPRGTPVQFAVNPGGSLWLTLDGTDPRLPGGGVSPTAIESSGIIQLDGPGIRGLVRLRARAIQGGEWSPLEAADFFVGNAPVRLNELQASNAQTLADEHGDYDDWCELFNRSSFPADLSGFRLSDDPADLDAFTFPEGTVLPAHGHLVVWLDGEPEQGPLHADFRLDQGGEQLRLHAPDGFDGLVLDEVSFGRQTPDASLGRIPNGSGPWVPSAAPSPGSSNALGAANAQ